MFLDAVFVSREKRIIAILDLKSGSKDCILFVPGGKCFNRESKHFIQKLLQCCWLWIKFFAPQQVDIQMDQITQMID